MSITHSNLMGLNSIQELEPRMLHFLTQLLNGPAHFTLSHQLNPLWTVAIVVAAFAANFLVLVLLLFSSFKALQNIRPAFSWLLRSIGVASISPELAFLELTFPSSTTKTALASEQLHNLLTGAQNYTNVWHRLAARKKLYSLELVSSRDGGIRYVIAVPSETVALIQHKLLSFLAGIKITVIEDYLQAITSRRIGVIELMLAADFALPLQSHEAIKQHDPIDFLMGSMTELSGTDLIACQIVTTAVQNNTHPGIIRKVRKIQRSISHGEVLSQQLLRRFPAVPHRLLFILLAPVWLVVVLGKLLVAIPLAIVSPNNLNISIFRRRFKQQQSSTNPYRRGLAVLVKTKLDQQLFEVSIRLLVSAEDEAVVKQRLTALLASFRSYTSPNQSIRHRQQIPLVTRRIARHDLPRFRARQLSPHRLSQPTILSSSELADLYHFPNTDFSKTAGLVKSRDRDLPIPQSPKQSTTEIDVVVGVNNYGGEEIAIGMTLEQRQQHTYVIGKAGVGKTSLLKSSIYQDMLSGKGLAVLDPHGDMFQELLTIIPEHRRKDVVVFDPSDRDFPVGLNLLDPGIEFLNDDDRQEWITATVLSVFAKLVAAQQWGPRMEHILRNVTMTALQMPNPSLYTMQRLLTDKQYQKKAANSLTDPVLKQFWLEESTVLGSIQMSSVIAPLTNRLGHCITTKMSRHISLQQRSSLRIADIMNDGKILLVNLSKGDLGEDQSYFFGTILTSFIWLAAFQRTKIPESSRRDFFVYIDEFDNFATPNFAEITSEGRKLHVSLIVSHHNIAQIEDTRILKTVASNVSTIICLKASPADEAFILPFMKPVIEKGDITNLAPLRFYMKVTSQDSEDAFSAQIVPLIETESQATKAAVLAYSRRQYGRPRAGVEAYMEDLFLAPEQKGPTTAPTSPVSTPPSS